MAALKKMRFRNTRFEKAFYAGNKVYNYLLEELRRCSTNKNVNGFLLELDKTGAPKITFDRIHVKNNINIINNEFQVKM
jgi:hypothetical protein